MRLHKQRKSLRMADVDRDTPQRVAAFEHVRRLGETHDHLTATELKPGFVFEGERVPLMNPQRGIFKPQQMRFLLSIRTVFPRPGARVWYGCFRHQLLLPRPYLVLTKPLRLDIQCQRGASVKIGWKYLDD